ncbi:MAG: hypothetical protein FJZ58_06670 [Chlamydiae bacterium]|nr:hypothetical protein [Chlamydiota bacterium]
MITKQLIHLFYKIYVCSFLFFVASLAYIRYTNLERAFSGMPLNVLSTLDSFFRRPPLWQDWDVNTKIAILSSQEVAKFLKSNLMSEDGFHENMKVTNTNEENREQKYLAMRFIQNDQSLHGVIKCYFSCFSHPITNSLILEKETPTTVILSFPSFLEKDKKHPCKARVHWEVIDQAGK